MSKLHRFLEIDEVEVSRVLHLDSAFWLPSSDESCMAEVTYDRDEGNQGGEIAIVVKYLHDGPDLTLSGYQFLALFAFLVEEGLLQACGVGGEKQAPAPPETERKGMTDVPFVASPGAQGGPEMLEDRDWLLARHHTEGLSISEIGRLVGRNAMTVKRWLGMHGIEYRSHRGQH